MADLLVRLYALPPLLPALAGLAQQGVIVRRALAPERHVVAAWARAHGSEGWASECEVAFARVPLACFVAEEAGAPAGPPSGVSPTAAAGYALAPHTLVGFACYDATYRNFFGPESVRPDRRGRGIGRALLLAALHAMGDQGYAYAIIGWASELEFYRRAAGAVVIEGSEPGIYRPPLIG
jgi:GNAT superfamily N-acetyltransferase